MLYEIVAVTGICLVTTGLAALILLPQTPQRLQFGKFLSSTYNADIEGVDIQCPIVLVGADHYSDWELIIDTSQSTEMDYAWETVHITSDGACDVLTNGAASETVERRSRRIDDDDLEYIETFAASWSENPVHQSVDYWASCGFSAKLTVRVRIGDELWAFNTDSIVTEDLAYFLYWLNDEVVEPTRLLRPAEDSIDGFARLSPYRSGDLATWAPCKDVTNELIRKLLAEDSRSIANLTLDYTAVTELSFLSHPRFEHLRSLDLSYTGIADLSTLPEEVSLRLNRLWIKGTPITTDTLSRDWDKLRQIPQIRTDVDLPIDAPTMASRSNVD
jgi:hypothetical protein